MSDTGRKPMGDKVSETVTPDSQKSYMEQVKEQITGAYDKVVRDMQPPETKSTSQSTADTVTGKSSDAKDTAETQKQSLPESAKQYAASAQKTTADTLHSAGDYVSDKSTESKQR
ncbi:heat shock protein 9/12-domain-containing protein [Lipomyces kononenkoae]